MKKLNPLHLTEEKKQKHLDAVKVYENLSYQFLWEMVASQLIPRTAGVTVPQTHGCLVCGHSVMEHGNYPYILDFLNNRWKIVCPSCGYTFPTNDFEAYYKGGLDENGFFYPNLAKAHDRELVARGEHSNLVNILYPEKGEKWGVDDGTGYTDPDTGIHYAFIGYYNHFAWNFYDKPNINNALTAFKNAYLASGDIAYAEKGIVLLDRIADVYPELDLARWTISEGHLNSNGGSIDKGKAVGSIWECGLVSDLMEAFQVLADVLKEDRAPNAVAFIKTKSHRCRQWGKEECAQTIYDRIMHGIVAQVYPSVMLAHIYGNYGMHQRALALAAVLWDKLPDTKDWLDFNFRTSPENQQRVYGGNISSVMIDRIDRDGYGNEAASGYNSIWLRHNLDIAELLDGYEIDGMQWDLFSHPKFRKMFFTMYPLIMCDIYGAKIGDNAACGNPSNAADMQILLRGFLKYGEPELAQAAYFLAKNSMDNLDTSGFIEDPEKVREKVQNIIDTYGTLKLKGTNLTRYGFIALRDGNAGDMWIDPKKSNQRAAWVYYGRNTGHGHRDTLNLGLIAYGLDVSPEMGYPRYADYMDMHRVSVVINTISHNTVVVNDMPQTPQIVGTPMHYDWNKQVKLFDVASEPAYRDIVDTYRRTGAMIRIDDDSSYVVDLFRVSGGESHCYSFHGAEHTKVVTTGLDLTKQTDANGNYIGTYAGPDTTYPTEADVRDVTGARYLINVDTQKGNIGQFTADYSLADSWNILGDGAKAPTDIHLKLTMLDTYDEVVAADLMPPENKPGNPKTLRYILAKRKGENLKSCYTAVIEPYRSTSKIAAIETLPVTLDGNPVCTMLARAVKVTLVSGRVDYIVNAIDPAITYTVTDGEESFAFAGFFGIWTRDNDTESFYINDGTKFGTAESELSALTGTVVDFTRELSVENEVTVRPNQTIADPTQLIGRYINIDCEINNNASYEIKSAVYTADGNLKLNIGDITLIRSFVDAYDFSKGYIYDIEEGRAFRIPLSWEQ